MHKGSIYNSIAKIKIENNMLFGKNLTFISEIQQIKPPLKGV